MNVLVVEDNEDIRFLLHKLLPLHAPVSDMRLASTGDAAIDVITDFRPDVVILDSQMVGSPAPQTASMIRTIHPTARLVSFSGMPGAKEWADIVVPKRADGIGELVRVLNETVIDRGC